MRTAIFLALCLTRVNANEEELSNGWTKVGGKTCNADRVVKGNIGITLDDCKKEADKASAQSFSWGATRHCLLCFVDKNGNRLDKDGNVISWDWSTTYDFYFKNQAGTGWSCTEETRSVLRRDGETAPGYHFKAMTVKPEVHQVEECATYCLGRKQKCFDQHPPTNDPTKYSCYCADSCVDPWFWTKGQSYTGCEWHGPLPQETTRAPAPTTKAPTSKATTSLKAPDSCSQQGFDFGAWCDFEDFCGAAYAKAGLVLGEEAQRDGFPCPDGSKAVERSFEGVHPRKCCSCGGTFCPATTTTTTTTEEKVGPVRTCKSIGDPHIYPFNHGQFGRSTKFDNYHIGWKTLYTKGDLKIQALQEKWVTNSVVATNTAVRYTTKASTLPSTNDAAWWTGALGQTIEVSSTGAEVFAAPSGSVNKKLTNGNLFFPGHALTLQIFFQDYRGRRGNMFPGHEFFYDVWIITNDIAGAKGQCVDGMRGQDARRRSLADFPTGDDVKVTEAQAEQACANLTDAGLKEDCVSDIRMVNHPDFTDALASGFSAVEIQDKAIANGAFLDDSCSQQGFDFGAWCDFEDFCGAAYAKAGLVLGEEAQRDGFPCPDGSKAVERSFEGVHPRKCCSCGGTFCPAATNAPISTTTAFRTTRVPATTTSAAPSLTQISFLSVATALLLTL